MRSAVILLVCAVLCSACFDPPPPIIEEPDVIDASDTVAGDTTEEVNEEVVESLCVTDCNGHGVCDESTGLCECSAAWTGSDCSVCAPDYFGPECGSCACVNGACEDGLEGSGACTCADGWAGATCAVDLAVPWSDGPYGANDGDVAGDVSFPTESGAFSLAQAWTGQDSVLFLFHYPVAPESATLWGDDPKDLFATLPLNTHIVFGSFDDNHETDVASMRSRVTSALNQMSAQLRAHWEERVHYVSEKVGSFDGPLDERINASSSYKFGVDRYQRWRSLGALYDTSVQTSSLSFFGHEPWGYNGEHEARSAAAAREGVSLTLFDKVGLSPSESAQATVTLPSQAQLDALDSLAIEAHVHCTDDKEGPTGGCISVPNTVQLYVCDADGTCEVELARWVTPYARSGSWLIDASPLLPLLGSGEDTTFEVRSEHAVWVEIRLVLANLRRDERPVAATPLWNHTQGQGFDVAYCTEQPSVDVVAPEDATRAELVTRITGHGETGTVDGCAAACSHAHHVGVGETVFTQVFEDPGEPDQCLDLESGVTPNQFGLWTQWRAGWCSGGQVTLHRQDITEALGEGQTLTYAADREGEPYVAFTVDPEGSMPSIKMASWVVFYGPKAN